MKKNNNSDIHNLLNKNANNLNFYNNKNEFINL